MRISKRIVVGLVATVLGAAVCAAQSLPDLEDIAARLRLNQEMFQKFSWTSEFSYSIDGVLKREEVFKVKHTFEGVLERRQISGTVNKEKVRRPNGKKLKKKEREAAYSFVRDVKKQFDAYLNPMFAERAVLTSTVTTTDDYFVLESHDVVTTGDVVKISIAKADLLPKSVEVTTSVDGSPVSLEMEMGVVDADLSYPSRSVTKATWEDFDLEIVTESSDYKRVR